MTSLSAPAAASTATLNAELETAVVRALLRDFQLINWGHFRDALKTPVFVLSDATTRLGRWSAADRTIEISRKMVLEQPWGSVVEVLKHEMAHQYVAEVIGAHEETAHGEAFRRICEKLGIDASASGMPSAAGPLPVEDSRILQRIARLLALAESDNQHEAEAAMTEAQRLMLKHNIAAAETAARRGYTFRHLGEPTGRLQGYQRVMASLLGAHFFVEPIWITVHSPLTGRSGTVLEICGTEANLEMASYVHDFLLRTAERLWRDHKRGLGIRLDADRRSFLLGVVRGFRDKLLEEQTVHRQEGLVWVKDPSLGDYLHRRHPRQQVRKTSTRTRGDAFAAGKVAGRAIVLHKPVSSGSSSAGGVRLLPARRS